MDAVLSDCKRYRYELTRWVARPQQYPRTVCWVMLNPSTADATTDDPTIRRVMGFSEDWGFHRVRVVNVFAFRTKDPKDLNALSYREIDGPENAVYVWRNICQADRVVYAWGGNGRASVSPLVSELRKVTRDIHCLKQNKDGSPGHPLYLAKDTPSQLFIKDLARWNG